MVSGCNAEPALKARTFIRESASPRRQNFGINAKVYANPRASTLRQRRLQHHPAQSHKTNAPHAPLYSKMSAAQVEIEDPLYNLRLSIKENTVPILSTS